MNARQLQHAYEAMELELNTFIEKQDTNNTNKFVFTNASGNTVQEFMNQVTGDKKAAYRAMGILCKTQWQNNPCIHIHEAFNNLTEIQQAWLRSMTHNEGPMTRNQYLQRWFGGDLNVYLKLEREIIHQLQLTEFRIRRHFDCYIHRGNYFNSGKGGQTQLKAYKLLIETVFQKVKHMPDTEFQWASYKPNVSGLIPGQSLYSKADACEWVRSRIVKSIRQIIFDQSFFRIYDAIKNMHMKNYIKGRKEVYNPAKTIHLRKLITNRFARDHGIHNDVLNQATRLALDFIYMMFLDQEDSDELICWMNLLPKLCPRHTYNTFLNFRKLEAYRKKQPSKLISYSICAGAMWRACKNRGVRGWNNKRRRKWAGNKRFKACHDPTDTSLDCIRVETSTHVDPLKWRYDASEHVDENWKHYCDSSDDEDGLTDGDETDTDDKNSEDSSDDEDGLTDDDETDTDDKNLEDYGDSSDDETDTDDETEADPFDNSEGETKAPDLDISTVIKDQNTKNQKELQTFRTYIQTMLILLNTSRRSDNQSKNIITYAAYKSSLRQGTNG